MGDSLQQQFDKILALFLKEQATNKARQEELSSKLGILTWNVANVKQRDTSPKSSGHSRATKTQAVGSLESSEANAFVPKFTKLDFPRFNSQEDPLGWLNRAISRLLKKKRWI